MDKLFRREDLESEREQAQQCNDKSPSERQVKKVKQHTLKAQRDSRKTRAKAADHVGHRAMKVYSGLDAIEEFPDSSDLVSSLIVVSRCTLSHYAH